MKRRIRILAIFAVLTVLTDYVSGRWALFFLIPPVIIPAFLTLLAAGWVLLPCRDGGPFWRRWVLRIFALAACWGLLRLPSYLEEDDDYFRMGRRAHIRSTFTPALIAEIRAAASKLASRKDKYECVDLKAADLPPAVSGTLWGMPGYASCSFKKEGRLSSVRLVWGGSLIGRHGLVISDEEIPFRGHGFHGGGKDGHEEVYYPERYYPLHPGSYIYLDEN